MSHAIDFAAAPAAGHTLEWGGQTYAVMSAVNVTLRGVHACSIMWRTTCPDCHKAHLFETGGRRRHLPKRCTACNGADDKDALERRAFARIAWTAGVARAREAKRGGVARLEGVQLNRLNMLECEAVLQGGERVPIRWAPGHDMADEAPGIRKALPLFRAEHERLMAERLLA